MSALSIRRDRIPAVLRSLVRLCTEKFGKSLHASSMGRILRGLGLSRQKARPSHPQKDPAAQAAVKKSPATAENNSAFA
jgi:transposase